MKTLATRVLSSLFLLKLIISLEINVQHTMNSGYTARIHMLIEDLGVAEHRSWSGHREEAREQGDHAVQEHHRIQDETKHEGFETLED